MKLVHVRVDMYLTADTTPVLGAWPVDGDLVCIFQPCIDVQDVCTGQSGWRDQLYTKQS